MAIVLGVSTCPPGARRPSCLDASGGAARRSPDPVRRSVFSLGSFFWRPWSHLHLREFQTFRGNLGAFTVEWEVWTR